MKYLSRFIVISLCFCILAGCEYPKLDEISARLCDAPITAAECFYSLGPTDFTEKHYLDAPLTVDLPSAVSDYVGGIGAATSFARRYRDSDHVDIYPVYGTYLEPTDMVLCVFSSGGVRTGIGSLTLGVSDGAPSSNFKDMTERPTAVFAHSLEDCFLTIDNCAKEHPDFQITGIVYSTEGFPQIYPIGISPDSGRMQFVQGEPKDFAQYFTTPEEGHTALTQHRDERCEHLSKITVFPWKSRTCSNNGYLPWIVDPKLPSPDTYDLVVAVPLLSKTLEEDVYVLHLFYRDYQLVAEVVVQRRDVETAGAYEIVWERSAGGDPLTESEYLRVLEDAAHIRNGWAPRGVIFDNGFYPIGIADQAVFVYHPESKKLQAYR